MSEHLPRTVADRHAGKRDAVAGWMEIKQGGCNPRNKGFAIAPSQDGAERERVGGHGACVPRLMPREERAWAEQRRTYEGDAKAHMKGLSRDRDGNAMGCEGL